MWFKLRFLHLTVLPSNRETRNCLSTDDVTAQHSQGSGGGAIVGAAICGFFFGGLLGGVAVYWFFVLR